MVYPFLLRSKEKMTRLLEREVWAADESSRSLALEHNPLESHFFLQQATLPQLGEYGLGQATVDDT